MNDNPPHRKSVKRLDIPGHAHELTFSCYGRKPFLRSDRTRRYLVNAITKAKVKHHFDLWAYVIMPEHVHLLIWPRHDDYSIAGILRSIKQSVSRRAVEYLKRHNPAGLSVLTTGQKYTPYRFWLPGGGYDRSICNPESYGKVMDYIHRNPVKRGSVSSPQEWYWSSAQD